jgi:hypothetical protein
MYILMKYLFNPYMSKKSYFQLPKASSSNHVKYRMRMVSSSNHAKYKTRRRREHPMDTSEGVKWPSVTTDFAKSTFENFQLQTFFF